MRRRMSMFLSAISLLLCMGICALSVVSYIGRTTGPHTGPHVRVIRLDEGDENWFVVRGRFEEWITTPWDGQWYPERNMPLWAPAILFLIVSAAFAFGSKLLPRAERYYPTVECRKCGYLLTGNVSGTCPECGTARFGIPGQGKADVIEGVELSE